MVLSFHPTCRDPTAVQGRGRTLASPHPLTLPGWATIGMGLCGATHGKMSLGVTVGRQDQKPKCRTTLGTL